MPQQRGRSDKFGLAFGIFWTFCFLLSLGIIAGVIYVAIHFLAKVW